MPSLEPRRRSRARFEEEDDEQSAESDSPKRQKRSTNGALSDEEDDDQDEERISHGKEVKSSPSRAGLGNRTGGFQTGAIVRVLVQNFVTYEHAEFKPGPNLNMVIGPNGTGKSSLVCAICLGLGYSPKNLGRGDKMGEFVKHGKEAATVEIELQGRPDDRGNHVIRLQIRKEDNRCKWWLNGKDSQQQNVKELVNALHIQIDNLCQFLPQDRVAEFAGLTPVQLLHETLRAAAPEKMITWHEQLKAYHKRYKDLKKELDQHIETLKTHETRQQGSQADVDRLRDREAIQQRIQELGIAHVYAEYMAIQKAYLDCKAKNREAMKKLKELEEACGPAFQAVNQKDAYRKKIEAVVRERRDALKKAEAACDRLVETIEAQDEQLKQVQIEKKAEQDFYASKRTDITKIRRTITDLKAKSKNKPPEFVAGDYNMQIRQKEAILRENNAEKAKLNSQLEETTVNFNSKNAEKKRLETELQNLNSQEGQKLSQLKKIHPDAAKGWEWLQEHQDEFQKEVFGPPMLSCSITNQRYSDQIQSLLMSEDFLCFTCQTSADHKKLSAQFYKHMALGVSIRTCGSDFASFRPPIPKQQIGEMGLDAYAIEYLDGPEPVLAMLCSEKKLHVCGVALRDVSNDQFEQISNCERIPSWASGRTLYRVQRRREYGGNAVSTSTRKIMPGRFWTDQPVDQSERTALQTQINQADEELEMFRKQATGLSLRIKEVGADDGPVNLEIDRLKAEKNELQKAAMQYATLGDKITAEEKALEDALNALAGCRMRTLECGQQEDQLIVKKAKSVLEHREQLSQVRDAHQALLEVQIRHIEAQSDVAGLEQQNTDVRQQLDEKKVESESLREELDKIKAEGVDIRNKFSDLVDGGDMAYWKQLVGERTPEDIDDEIGAESAKLELIQGVDPSILRQYNKRAQEIQELTKKKEETNSKLDSIAKRMEKKMKDWEPRVDEVVSKINDAFSYNFEQINCAGEVGIHKDEDFEQWAIEIKVKFRENETLQQLNQHRQSGGERAVSTIFYLMALQSMAQAPFRVVDEINQGMDPRNERMVHERMVEIACREHTSQYFLITPKLLTGLRYDERMRVLCIASGEHMPSAGEAKGLDFGNLVRIQRAIASAA
ncbi:hypothetical protein Hte_009179 [Hypoxylon texense]